MFSYLKIAAIGAVVVFAAGLYWYVSNLQATVRILEANNVKLEYAVSEQQRLIEQQQRDTQSITAIMKSQAKLTSSLTNSLIELNEKFHKVNGKGVQRDIGRIGERKPLLVQNIINKSTTNALRCFELLTGDALKENEKNEDCPINGTDDRDTSGLRAKGDRTSDNAN